MTTTKLTQVYNKTFIYIPDLNGTISDLHYHIDCLFGRFYYLVQATNHQELISNFNINHTSYLQSVKDGILDFISSIESMTNVYKQNYNFKHYQQCPVISELRGAAYQLDSLLLRAYFNNKQDVAAITNQLLKFAEEHNPKLETIYNSLKDLK